MVQVLNEAHDLEAQEEAYLGPPTDGETDELTTDSSALPEDDTDLDELTPSETPPGEPDESEAEFSEAESEPESETPTAVEQARAKQIAQLNEAIAAKVVYIQARKGEIESAKAAIKTADAELEGMSRRLVRLQSGEPIQSEMNFESAEAETPEVESATGGGPSTDGDGADDWQGVPTADLTLDAIKGFGGKLIEKIIAAAPTLGQLEELRAGEGGLQSIQGMGREKADRLEEHILDYLSQTRDKETLEQMAAESLTPVEVEENEQTDGELPEVDYSQHDAYESGRQAKGRRFEIDDNPWMPGSEGHEAWRAGWEACDE